jgi:hypothetical protein
VPTLQYGQTGITNDILEDLRRRQRERGQPAPYAPSNTGMTEQATESAINRAQVNDQNAGEAVEALRADARLQLRAPMSGPAPSQPMALSQPMTGAPRMDYTPEPAQPQAPAVQKPQMTMQGQDDAAREAMVRAERRQRVIRAMGALGALFGSRDQDANRRATMQMALEANDPMQYQTQIDARAATAAEAAEAKRAATIEDEDRALNAEYRRTLMRSMDTNANRREFEMTSKARISTPLVRRTSAPSQTRCCAASARYPLATVRRT